MIVFYDNIILFFIVWKLNFGNEKFFMYLYVYMWFLENYLRSLFKC